MTTITLSFNSFGDEAQQFAEWLNAKGYDARVGRTSQTTVEDGEADVSALWDEFCRS